MSVVVYFSRSFVARELPKASVSPSVLIRFRHLTLYIHPTTKPYSTFY